MAQALAPSPKSDPPSRAVAYLNAIRAYAGLTASSVTTASSNAAFEDELLKQRRFSLFAEGHRWVDMRRYGRLDQLPRDLTTGTNAHFVARVMPIPQSECLVRARANDPALAGPGC